MSEGAETPDETSEVMRYGMVGEDRSSDAEKIAKYTGVVDWTYVQPHFESGALIWADPALSLQEVAEALVKDETETVKKWLKQGDFIRPSDLHAAQWSKGDWWFRAVVVAPFVIIQAADGPED